MEIRSTETRTAQSLAPGAPAATVSTVSHDLDSPPLYSIRWSAILAGLAVGLGVHVLLMLIGITAGFAVFGAGERPEGESITVAAGIWNTVSMLISAFVGGYVASRSSGLRRTSDGMLHGVVSWGATMLFFSLVTGSVTGNALSGLVGTATNTAATAVARPGDSGVGELLSSLERGDRAAAVAALQNRFGMTSEQANRAADQALTMTGRSPMGADTRPAEVATDAAQRATAASAWLSGAILLSLLAGAGGGLLGARGAQRRALPHRYEGHEVTTTVRRRVPTPS